MKKLFQSGAISTGLAIFAMFFGAGNLIFPIKVGVDAGTNNPWAMIGFLLTAVVLPFFGLLAIILFDGDYQAFFNRVGRAPGFLMTLVSILIIGPFIAMPRIVSLSYIMMQPFLYNMPLFVFSVLFLTAAFLGAYNEGRILDLLGWIISPLKIISMLIIIIKGLWSTGAPIQTSLTPLNAFFTSLKIGYNTLDVLGAIFFSSIVLTILKQNLKEQGNYSSKALTIMSIKAGVIGTTLLGLIYIGMSYLGVFYGYNLANINEGEVFSTISFRILGNQGAIIIAIAVLMACFSTVVALAAAVTEYLHYNVFHKKINYVSALFLALSMTCITSNLGLGKILELSAPIIEIGYPVLIVLTLLNIAYKLWGFKPVKVPVVITLIASIVNYYFL